MLGYDGFSFSQVTGYAGGIILSWKKSNLNINVLKITPQFIHTVLSQPNERDWNFTAVYASPYENKRRQMWRELEAIGQAMTQDWLIAGDFNDISVAVEKKEGGSIPHSKIIRFNENINNCHLIDLGSVGSLFTWKGPKYYDGQHIFKRLDRAMCNASWTVRFPEAIVRVLARVLYSDHHCLLLMTKGNDMLRANNKFRFESSWLTEATYQDTVKAIWNQNNQLDTNLMNLKQNLMVWHRQTVKEIKKKKRTLISRIAGIQQKTCHGGERAYLIKLEAKLQEELNTINYQEELVWFQRSRAKWLEGGDRNTKYYHLKATTRKKKNHVMALRNTDGTWEHEDTNLKNMITGHFKTLFSNIYTSVHWYQTSITYPIIDSDSMASINDPINDSEISKAMFSMAAWKSPGPDGFPAGFYQHTWDVVGPQVCAFITELWNSPSLISSINYTDICLIPKVERPEFVDQFRPISLCNSIYKVLSKILVNRLKTIVPNIISPFQSGFVPGRRIQENIVIAQEMIHSMNRSRGKTGYFAIKVDLSKAYDMMKWDFIDNCLKEVGLPNTFITIIMYAITSVWTNVNWNGGRNDYFQPSKGLRQGDPISPYLFVICMDKLSHLICDQVTNGNWIGIKAGHSGPMISHLMFADDLLLFGQATMEQIECVLDVINSFSSMSGQKVNYNKTSIMFSKTVSQAARRNIINKSGFREVHSLGKYLGVPLTGKAPNKNDYHYLIDQVQKRLTGWKTRYLSRAGRTTLATSVLQSIPIYPMLAVSLPKGTLNELEKIQRNFVWGDAEGHRKMHYVGWDILTKPKSMGGLGFRNLSQMNTACLLKLGWDLRINNDKLWCRVIKGKYARDPVDNMTWIHKAYDSSFWKSIAPLESFFRQQEYWDIGDGTTVNAWSTRWLTSEASILDMGINVPPDLTNLTVADLVLPNGNWDIAKLENWMPDKILDYFAAALPPSSSTTKDTPLWPYSPDGNYRVADGYKVLCNFVNTEVNPIWKRIWTLNTKERTRHHIWLVLHDRLFTNARREKMHLGSPYCYHCNREVETTLHVLRDCPIARNIWLHLLNFSKRNAFFGANLSNWISLNISEEMGNFTSLDWSALWANTTHLLWTWRNKATHEDDFVFPWKPWQVALKETNDYCSLQKLQVQNTTAAKQSRLISWKPPDNNNIKLNTDGSYLAAVGLAGCGGVLRDKHGTWKGGLSKSLGRCSAYLAELWGVYEGLLLAQSKGYFHLTVEVDALEIANTLQNGMPGRGEGRKLLRRISELIKGAHWNVQFQHIYKQANNCAHLLAVMGSHQIDSLIIHDVIPASLSKAVEDDVKGAGTPRVVSV